MSLPGKPQTVTIDYAEWLAIEKRLAGQTKEIGRLADENKGWRKENDEAHCRNTAMQWLLGYLQDGEVTEAARIEARRIQEVFAARGRRGIPAVRQGFATGGNAGAGGSNGCCGSASASGAGGTGRPLTVIYPTDATLQIQRLERAAADLKVEIVNLNAKLFEAEATRERLVKEVTQSKIDRTNLDVIKLPPGEYTLHPQPNGGLVIRTIERSFP